MAVQSLQGICAGCGKGIPWGYCSVVASWRVEVQQLGVKVQKPDVMYCQGCKDSAPANPTRKYHHKPAPEAPATNGSGFNVQEQAVKLYRAANQPMTSKELAKKAGVVYSPVVEAILKKLSEKHKMSVELGHWSRVGK
jgi:hypothetical protein